MTPPKTTLAEVLYSLIKLGSVTEQDFKMNGFRQRLSELRRKYLVPIDSVPVEFVNKYGHSGCYSKYVLKNKKFAKEVYNKINK